jgi:hypothetical protein
MPRSWYPLQWPDGVARRDSWRRGVPKFEAQFARDRDSVLRQLRRMGYSNIVITSDLPTRNDGLPYANARCEDPGIAVWWVHKGREHVIACDHWRTYSFNLRAIDMSIDAMRGLERWGASGAVERAFAGFAALPAQGETSETEYVSPPPAKRPWRVVLGEGTEGSRAWSNGEAWPDLEPDELLLLAKSRHRKLIQKHHPDRGGDSTIAAELNVALADAEIELGRGS